MLEISDKELEAALTKVLQQVKANTLERNGKIETLNKERQYEELSGNFTSGKYNNRHKSLYRLDRIQIVEELLDLKTE